MLACLPNSNGAHLLPITLPSDSIGASMFANKDDESQMTASNCTYTIYNSSMGIWHATNILAMLVDISMESANSHDATPAFQDYLAWILDSFLTSHGLQKRWEPYPQLREACKKSEILAFCAVQALLSSLENFLSDSMTRKGYALLSILCSDLLAPQSDVIEKSLHVNICSSILNLSVICKKYDSMRRIISLHLIPAIDTALLDPVISADLGKDFQV